MSSQNWLPSANLEIMQIRARMLQSIRAFFAAREVLEVETPQLASAAVTDLHIQSFKTAMRGDYFLQTSPEYAMKRLLAAGFPSIYQVCKVFRHEEQGIVHNPEFTMLEWYRTGFNYRQLIDEVSELLRMLAAEAGMTVSVNHISYHQAFAQSVGLDPLTAEVHQCRACCRVNNIDIPEGMSENNVDEWLDWILTQAVAPAFNKNGFTVLYDYPASQCALATINASGLVAERFELYFGELELANGFNELTDAAEQRARFEADNEKRKANGLDEMPIDENFLAALEQGLPECAGVAIGLDRLLMVLTGKENISDVLSFSFDRV